MTIEELLQQLLDQAAENNQLLFSMSQTLDGILGILKVLVFISGVCVGLFLVNLFAKAWLRNGA
jgi:hypothetical protein